MAKAPFLTTIQPDRCAHCLGSFCFQKTCTFWKQWVSRCPRSIWSGILQPLCRPKKPKPLVMLYKFYHWRPLFFSVNVSLPTGIIEVDMHAFLSHSRRHRRIAGSTDPCYVTSTRTFKSRTKTNGMLGLTVGVHNQWAGFGLQLLHEYLKWSFSWRNWCQKFEQRFDHMDRTSTCFGWC